MTNPKAFKEAIAKKCKQCVGGYNRRYEATTAELVDVCDKKSCGLYPFRPRLPTAEMEWFKDLIE